MSISSSYNSTNLHRTGSEELDDVVQCGFMELLLHYGKVRYMNNQPLVLMDDISQMLLQRNNGEKWEILKAYKQWCIDDYILKHPDIKALYNQETDHREMIKDCVLSEIYDDEVAKSKNALQQHKDIGQKNLVAIKIYFNEFLYVIKQEKVVSHPQKNGTSPSIHDDPPPDSANRNFTAKADEHKEEPTESKYTYNHEKVTDLFHVLCNERIITNQQYKSYQFEQNIDQADFSSAVRFFRSKTTLGVVLSLIRRMDCVNGRCPWYDAAVKSIDKTKKMCNNDFGKAKESENGWLRKVCKELDLVVERLTL